jgi:ADP-ribose pyrophosphatase YjhB (NUDIX family)
MMEKREYPAAPVVAVGAAVCRGGQVLVVKRGQEPALGRWVIPGGRVELGESPEAAAHREIREECGLEIRLGPVAAVVNRVDRDDAGRVRYHFVIIDYLAEYLAGELRPGSDAADARWVDPGLLTDLRITGLSADLLRQSIAWRDRPLSAEPRET